MFRAKVLRVCICVCVGSGVVAAAAGSLASAGADCGGCRGAGAAAVLLSCFLSLLVSFTVVCVFVSFFYSGLASFLVAWTRCVCSLDSRP